ncbi:MAG: DNA repair protein RecN [Candidatus Omnitrophica bacterium]|nr:DNA repair protein RecN [Candidatus Omnitrophota bacterium]
MLSQLTIKNFGLIDEVSLEFRKGLNILTGETGAGKSILIEALRVALGGRITATHVRDAQKDCIIEAVFDLADAKGINRDVVGEFFSDGEPQLILQRLYQADGRGKIKINGLTVTAAQLKNVGQQLIDFHGAHDHQMLLSPESHIKILDRLIDFGDCLERYQKQYQEYEHLIRQQREIQNLAQSRERELDMLNHQVTELGQVSLENEDYNRVKSDVAKIDNMERLNECLGQLIDIFDHGEYGISRKIQELFSPMRTLNNIDETTSKFMDELNGVQAQGDDLLAKLNDYASSLSFDSKEAAEVHRRDDIYDDLTRKYGPTIEDAKKFYNQARERLDLLSNLEHNDSKLKEVIEKSKKILIQTAAEITSLRKKVSKSLKKTIEQELTELGIENVQFECRVELVELNDAGADTVSFYISPNAGFEPKPLAEIVSSGEAARVMLALKKALIKVDPVPVLIFDEIDAQIGGRLGTITGQKLRDISSQRQVILITHLPQIASFADAHFKVVKSVKNKKTITEVLSLNKEERVSEIAQMMSGKSQSDISLKHAKDLLANAKK